MARTPKEWLRQAEYDMDTAEALFSAGRFFYAVFMCHLSLEKALKGLYLAKSGTQAPRTHNLIFLLDKTGAGPPETTGRFIVRLNSANVATRYPDDLETLERNFDKNVVSELLSAGKEAMEWIKKQY